MWSPSWLKFINLYQISFVLLMNHHLSLLSNFIYFIVIFDLIYLHPTVSWFSFLFYLVCIIILKSTKVKKEIVSALTFCDGLLDCWYIYLIHIYTSRLKTWQTKENKLFFNLLFFSHSNWKKLWLKLYRLGHAHSLFSLIVQNKVGLFCRRSLLIHLLFLLLLLMALS